MFATICVWFLTMRGKKLFPFSRFDDLFCLVLHLSDPDNLTLFPYALDFDVINGPFSQRRLPFKLYLLPFGEQRTSLTPTLHRVDSFVYVAS
jgi:hypothetical protein